MAQGLGKELLRPATMAVSTSTGTVKAGPGVLYGWIGTTTGRITIKDGATEVGTFSVTAGDIREFWRGMNFTTSITISSSAAVATILYT